MVDNKLLVGEFHPVKRFILWYIGIPAKEMTYMDKKTGKEIKGKKEKDGQATYSEVERYLTEYAKIERGVSRSMIHLLLKELEHDGLVKNVGAQYENEQGKVAIYRLTSRGEEMHKLLANYWDLKMNLGPSPTNLRPSSDGLLGRDKDKEGNMYFLSMIRISEKKDVDMIMQAYARATEEKCGTFMDGFFNMQRLAVLLYCSQWINPSVRIIFERIQESPDMKGMSKEFSEFFKFLAAR